MVKANEPSTADLRSLILSTLNSTASLLTLAYYAYIMFTFVYVNTNIRHLAKQQQ